MTKLKRDKSESSHAKAWAPLMSVLLCAIPFVVPRTPISIVIALSACFLASVPTALYGYRWSSNSRFRVGVLAVYAALLVGFGFAIWPRVEIAPDAVTFSEYEHQFRFRVENNTPKTAYSVEPVFHIAGLVTTAHDWSFDIDDEVTPMTGYFCSQERGVLLFPLLGEIGPGAEKSFILNFRGSTPQHAEIAALKTWSDPIPAERFTPKPGGFDAEMTLRAPIRMKPGECQMLFDSHHSSP